MRCRVVTLRVGNKVGLQGPWTEECMEIEREKYGSDGPASTGRQVVLRSKTNNTTAYKNEQRHALD